MPTANDVCVAMVRHGRTDWNAQGLLQGRTDIPLNEAGREEIRRTATFLTSDRWDALWSSPLMRATQSAELLSAVLRIPYSVAPCLKERDFGVFEGKHRDVFFAARHHGDDGSGATVEADAVLEKRAWQCLQRIVVTQACARRIVVVSHGSFINAFLHKISGGRHGTGVTQLANGGVTRLLWRAPHRWRVVSVNETGPL